MRSAPTIADRQSLDIDTTSAAVPTSGGVVVSFERMQRILDTRPGDRCAVVEPGVLNGDLQRALKPHGLFVLAAGSD